MWGVVHISCIGFSRLHIVLEWQFLPLTSAFFYSTTNKLDPLVLVRHFLSSVRGLLYTSSRNGYQSYSEKYAHGRESAAEGGLKNLLVLWFYLLFQTHPRPVPPGPFPFFILLQIKINKQLLSAHRTRQYSCPAAALRIILNIDGVPVTSRFHIHPSHSQTSRLLTSSLYLGVPVPHTIQCMWDVYLRQFYFLDFHHTDTHV